MPPHHFSHHSHPLCPSTESRINAITARCASHRPAIHTSSRSPLACAPAPCRSACRPNTCAAAQHGCRFVRRTHTLARVRQCVEHGGRSGGRASAVLEPHARALAIDRILCISICSRPHLRASLRSERVAVCFICPCLSLLSAYFSRRTVSIAR